MRARTTVMTGHEDVADALLRKGVTNSSVVFERLKEDGYAGGLTQVKEYIKDHDDLVPARRRAAAPQARRARRYRTDPGRSYQMDWGFVNVDSPLAGGIFRVACFAEVCHHCGMPYVEFFTNARQENLFIAMLHGFQDLGIPDEVLTDNMKSVVVGRDSEGRPVWQADFAAFMETVGFKTRLCKPYHPYTKDKVERLVRYVKDNFVIGRSFTDLDDLNAQAAAWCAEKGGERRRRQDFVAAEEHARRCMAHARGLEIGDTTLPYLFPERRISFDGFVSFEGRRFGVPFWYTEKTCRVSRGDGRVHIFDEGLARELVSHPVTWSREDSFCEQQWAKGAQPEETPSAPVTATLTQTSAPRPRDGFERFDFAGRL